MIMNIAWHSGYEIPERIRERAADEIDQYVDASQMHHFHVNCNSLYFNFRGRICGTNHPKYQEYYDAVVEGRSAA